MITPISISKLNRVMDQVNQYSFAIMDNDAVAPATLEPQIENGRCAGVKLTIGYAHNPIIDWCNLNFDDYCIVDTRHGHTSMIVPAENLLATLAYVEMMSKAGDSPCYRNMDLHKRLWNDPYLFFGFGVTKMFSDPSTLKIEQAKWTNRELHLSTISNSTLSLMPGKHSIEIESKHALVFTPDNRSFDRVYWFSDSMRSETLLRIVEEILVQKHLTPAGKIHMMDSMASALEEASPTSVMYYMGVDNTWICGDIPF